MLLAISNPLTPGSKARDAPSGKVTEIMGWSPSRSLAGTNRRKLLFALSGSWTVQVPEPIPQTQKRRKRGFIPGTRP
jgi:hypothetical protein